MDSVIKEMAKNFVYASNKELHTHVLICKDNFFENYFPRFVKFSEDVNDVINNINKGSYNNVLEVYNLSLDIPMQLSEEKPYHNETFILKDIDTEKVDFSLQYATKMHEGQTRKDKTPYITHPIRVANLVKDYCRDNEVLNFLLACSYLHDTLEDTKTTYNDLIDIFGFHIASIVNELTTNEELKIKVGKENYLEVKMKNMSNYALVIKLCDRLDNISDLNTSSKDFRERYSKETIGIIKFLVENRLLTKTQLIIIKDILTKLRTLELDNTEYNKIDNILDHERLSLNLKSH